MDKDELRKLLNLKLKEVLDPPTPVPKATQASPWALKLDAFDQAQGSKLIRHNPEIQKTNLTQQEVADFYALHYLPTPTPVEECQDPRRLEFVQSVLESPEHKALHRRTELNSLASELATEELSKSYAKLREEDKEREEAQKAGGLTTKRAEAQKELSLLNAVSSALQKSEKKVDELEESMAALGCGSGVGGNLDSNKVAKLFHKVKDNAKLRRIFDRAGRCRRFAQAQKRQKVVHGYDDMIGVTLSGQVGRLLPTELLQLIDPDLELDATRRLLENQSLSKEYQGVERVGKGPIVMCVDESGSMSGDPVEWAKAIALTLAWIAKSQNRFCVLIGYSGGTEGTKLVLPPHKWNEEALLEWLTHFFSGGTDMDVPLEQLPHQWWSEFLKQGMPRGRTDLILVTDAICHVPVQMEEKFLDWKKKEQVKCISIVLGGDGGGLVQVSDELHCVSSLDLGQEVIQKVLSL